MLFAPVGREGQERIGRGRVLVVGCGALGSSMLEVMARAGVGTLRFVDRDFVEWSNLQRQALFAEADAEDRTPKAAAAERALSRINSQVLYEPVVADFHAASAPEMAAGMDLILDGTDNFETRFLINEVAVKNSLPWVYGGCVGASGTCMPVVPQRTPCLRCILAEPADRVGGPTCDTMGIIAPAARMVAAMQSAWAIRILASGPDDIPAVMNHVDCWTGELHSVDMSSARLDDCPVCVRGEYRALSGDGASRAVAVCGRDMVQIDFPGAGGRQFETRAFENLVERLSAFGPVQRNDFLLSFAVPPHEFVLFKDGRCMVKGTSDTTEAKNLYARYIGL